jgi:hypothetical protein
MFYGTKDGRVAANSEEISRNDFLELMHTTSNRKPRRDFMDAFEHSESDFEDADSFLLPSHHYQQFSEKGEDFGVYTGIHGKQACQVSEPWRPQDDVTDYSSHYNLQQGTTTSLLDRVSALI